MNDSTHYKIIQSRYTTQNVRILKKKERRKKKKKQSNGTSYSTRNNIMKQIPLIIFTRSKNKGTTRIFSKHTVNTRFYSP